MVFNPCGWTRTDLVFVAPVDQPVIVVNPEGATVPSQRLSTGELVFLAKDIPGFAARRYELKPQEPTGTVLKEAPRNNDAVVMGSSRYELVIEATTGNVVRLHDKALNQQIVASDGTFAGAEFLYVPGRDPKDVQRVTAQAKVNWLDSGPLVQRVIVDGMAPGCRNLRRIYEVAEGPDYIRVEFIIDKEKVRTPEGVHLAFPFSIPNGEINLGLAWAFMNPWRDQLPGSCKHYFTVQHWADVSNQEFGATWVSLEAPLVELGKIRMDVPKPFDPDAWLTELEPTQTILSYVMNNYWETNYKADQEGPTVFRYALAPHGRFEAGAAARFGIERSQPLVAAPVALATPPVLPRLRVDPADVLVILPLPLVPGSVIRCRPVGVLKMSDEAGSDEKILAVPVDKVFNGYSHIDDIAKVSKHWLQRIGHFFEHYKDLEDGKWVKLDGWDGVAEARKIIIEAIERYNASDDKPKF